MSRRTRNPFQLKSLGKITKPFMNIGRSIINTPKNLLRTTASTVNSISSNLSMPLMIVGGVVLIYVVTNK